MENEGAGGMHGMPGMGGMSSSRLPQGAEFNVLKLSVMAGERSAAPLPAKLSDVRAIRTEGAPERTIELSMDRMRFLINGRSFGMNDISFDV